MKETNKITYDFGKLKRFLTVVRLQMQDTILTLVRRCYTGLSEYLLSFVPTEVKISNPNDVTNVYAGKKAEKEIIGLFVIDLVKTQND